MSEYAPRLRDHFTDSMGGVFEVVSYTRREPVVVMLRPFAPGAERKSVSLSILVNEFVQVHICETCGHIEPMHK